MKISEYCKNIRINKGINVLSFSKELDCSHSYILNVESGKYDEPTSLVLAKIIMIYKLDINEFISSIDNVFSNSYINDTKRHINKSIGTKPINNEENIINKFNNEYLIPNKYYNLKQYKQNKQKYWVCYKKNTACILHIIADKSTIMVEKDKNIISQEIEKIIFNISIGLYEKNNKNINYEIIILTPSKKIINYVKQLVQTPHFELRKNYKLGIALSRPKRPIKYPYYF